MEDAKSFLLSSYWGPGPLATTADTATMAPHSFSLTRAGTCLALLASKGAWVDQIIRQQNKRGFLPFYCSMHTCNLTHSVSLNLV